MKGVMIKQKSSPFYTLRLLSELREFELLELNSKCEVSEVELSECECGRLYISGEDCLRCEKLMDNNNE